MREDKWGVVERFRVRDAWRGRVESEHPQLLSGQMNARGRLLEIGAHVIGPFHVVEGGVGWLTIAWQFPDRATADALRALWTDPLWCECVEHLAVEGAKFDPFDTLPGFD